MASCWHGCHATGTLHLSTTKGSLTLRISSPASPIGSVPPSHFHFSIASGTGSYRHVLDEGSATLKIARINSGTTEFGRFSLTFKSDRMAIPLLL